MRRIVSTIVSPLLCLALLGGVYAEKQRRIQPKNVEPFHARVREEIQSLPYQLNGWIGKDVPIPPAAMKLLHPNVMISRMYVNPAHVDQWCGLLIEECRDSRDMLGHYPPICYPAHGMTQISAKPRNWQIAGLAIDGMQYVFISTDGGQRHTLPVYNFMVVPGVGVKRNMEGVQRAAKDYQERYFGAAQIQMTFPSGLSQQEQDDIFTQVMSPNVDMLKTLIAGGHFK